MFCYTPYIRSYFEKAALVNININNKQIKLSAHQERMSCKFDMGICMICAVYVLYILNDHTIIYGFSELMPHILFYNMKPMISICI